MPLKSSDDLLNLSGQVPVKDATQHLILLIPPEITSNNQIRSAVLGVLVHYIGGDGSTNLADITDIKGCQLANYVCPNNRWMQSYNTGK